MATDRELLSAAHDALTKYYAYSQKMRELGLDGYDPAVLWGTLLEDAVTSIIHTAQLLDWIGNRLKEGEKK